MSFWDSWVDSAKNTVTGAVDAVTPDPVANLYGKVEHAGMSVVASPFRAFEPAVQAGAWSYNNLFSQPISAWNLYAQGDADNIVDAYHKAEHISPAQSALSGYFHGPIADATTRKVLDKVARGKGAQDFIDKHASFLSDDFDINDPEQRKNAFDTQVAGTLLSGAGDTAISFIADPFILGGAALHAGRLAALARPAANEKYVPVLLKELDQYDAWKAAGGVGKAPNGMGQVAENTLTMNDRQVRRYIETAGSRTSDPELAAAALGATDDSQVTSNILRTFLGSRSGLEALRTQRADVAAMLERTRTAREKIITGMDSPEGGYWEGEDFYHVDQATLDRTNAEFAALKANRGVMENAEQGYGIMSGRTEATAAKYPWVERMRARRAIKGESLEFKGYQYDTEQANRFARPIVTITKAPQQWNANLWREAPSGYVNTKGVAGIDSSREIVAALQDVKLYDGLGEAGANRRRDLTSLYIAANTSAAPDVARARAVETIESRVAQDILDHYEVPYGLGDVEEIMRSYSARREALTSHVKKNGYWVDEDGAFVSSPVMDTQLANGMPIMDFRELERAVKRAKGAGGMPSSPAFRDRMAGLNSIFQQVWRPTVLMRGAFPIRNVPMESSLRGIVALDSVTELYGHGVIRKGAKNFSVNMSRRARQGFRSGVPLRADLQAEMFREGYTAKRLPKVNDYLAWKEHTVYALEGNLAKARKAASEIEDEASRIRQMLQGHIDPEDAHALQDRLNEMEERLNGLNDNQHRIAQQIKHHTQRMEAPSAKAEKLAPRERSNEGYDTVNGKKLPQPFNQDFEINRPARMNASADSKWEMIRNGSTLTDELNLANSDWGEAKVFPGEPHYYVEASEILNKQVRNSEAWRRWFTRADTGEGDEGVINWLMGRDPEALKVRSYMRIDDAGKARDFLEQMETRVRSKWDDDELLRHALDNEVTPGYLREWGMKNPELLKPVHGREIGMATGTHWVLDKYQGAIRKIFRVIGSLPESTLIREPFYAARYKAIRDQLVVRAQMEGREISVEELNDILHASHKGALRDLKRNIYTIERYSNFSRTMENYIPFMQATENAVRTWGRLWRQNPKWLGIMYWVWNAPNRAGIVYDGETGQKKEGWTSTPFGDNEYVVMPLPHWMSRGLNAMPGVSTGGQDQIALSKQSADVILQKLQPGPYMAYAANAIADMRPPQSALEDKIYDFFMPYGPARTPLNADVLLGGWQKNFLDVYRKEDSYTYNTMVANIARTEDTNWRLGLRDTKPTASEIIDRANQLTNLKVLSSFFSPIAIQFQSPFDHYSNEYKRLVDQYGVVEGGQKFYELYGDDYVAWTEGSSTSNAGMDPTTAAAKLYEDHKDLVDKVIDNSDPEFVQFITNNEDNGDGFSQGVWAWQFNESLGSGGGEKIRTQKSARDVLAGANETAGWDTYTKLTNDLNLVAQQRGEDSMTDDPELTSFRAKWVAQQEQENYDFFKSYSQRDDARSIGAVRALQTILGDKSYMDDQGGRPTWKAVGTYMDARAKVAQVLQDRDAAGGSASLQATSNQDVVQFWTSFTSQLSSQDATFAQWYDRYLENDPLTPVEVQ